MSLTDPRFAGIQTKLQSLGLYPQGPVDTEFGPLMDAGINTALDRLLANSPSRPAVAPSGDSDGAGTQDYRALAARLPAGYAWLGDEPYLPRHLVEALKLFGTVEVPGTGNSPVIMSWSNELHAAGVDVSGYTADSVPWCGLFQALVMERAHRPVPAKPLWALSWAKWGEDGGQPELGDVLVFKREGGGHVAQYIAEDAMGYYHILGGNQGDRVNIMRIAKSRLYACRQLVYISKPANIRPVVVLPTGNISSNEA